MVQLIKKGGLRERANRSRSYQGSENTATTLQRYGYRAEKNTDALETESGTSQTKNGVIPQPDRKNQE